MTQPVRTNESGFQDQILQLARMFKWRVAHFRPAMTRSGRWVTPVQADGAGWPDLTLVKGPRLIFAEVKSERGQLRAEQAEWLMALSEVERHNPHVMATVWRPGTWDRIVELLKGDA